MALENCYNSEVIIKLIIRKQRNIVQNQVYINEPPDPLSVLIFHSLTLARYRTANIFDKYFRVRFKSTTTLRMILTNSKDKLDILSRTGMYQLTCESWSAIYLGMSRRQFRVCIREHSKFKQFTRNRAHIWQTESYTSHIKYPCGHV